MVRLDEGVELLGKPLRDFLDDLPRGSVLAQVRLVVRLRLRGQ